MGKNQEKDHNITLKNRKIMNLDGVNEVVSYNEDNIYLKTNLGYLEIKGKNLNIQKLNLESETVKIKGYINNLIYTNKTKEKNFIKRMFK